jgi:hypothetical protein
VPKVFKPDASYPSPRGTAMTAAGLGRNRSHPNLEHITLLLKFSFPQSRQNHCPMYGPVVFKPVTRS